MSASLVTILAGALFGFGLALSGMVRPEVVLSFLRGQDFGLMLVMGGGLAVTFAAYQLAPRWRRTPLLAAAYESHTARMHRDTFVGSALFSAQATSYIVDWVFMTKMTLVLLGAVTAGFLQPAVAKVGPGAELSGGTKAVAGVAIVIWVVAIVIMSRYRIDRARHGEIAAALAERRLTAMPD